MAQDSERTVEDEDGAAGRVDADGNGTDGDGDGGTDRAAAATGRRPLLPSAVVILVGLAAAVAVLAGARAASSIVAPVVLALVIVIGVYPLLLALDRHMPRWAAALITMVVTYVGVALFVLALGVSAREFAELLPEYQDQADELTADTYDLLARYGIDNAQIDDALSNIDAGSLLGAVNVLLDALLSTFNALLLVLVLLFFLLVDAATMPQRMSQVARHAPGVARSLQDLTAGIRRFLIVTTVFGAIVAVVDVGILYAFDVPLPLLWGLLSFLTNYIPNIGLIIGLIPPALVALLDEGWVVALWVTILWLLANFFIQTLLQPKVVGDAVGLSVTMTVVSVFLWGWILGALGALLAVPLSLAAKEMLFDENSSRGWVSPLVNSWNDQDTQDVDPIIAAMSEPWDEAVDEASGSTRDSSGEEPVSRR